MKSFLLFSAFSFFLGAICLAYGEFGVGTSLLGLGGLLSLIGFGPSPEAVADGDDE